MSVFQKLNDAREKFHSLKLTKTGENKFAGYKYFELGDFLIPALGVFREAGLCAVVTFSKEVATMRIIDIESTKEIILTSPMGSAALKGCHEVQNIGAVETYQRRYLWVAALEIVEHDALDATTGRDKPQAVATSFRSSATMGISSTVPPERMKVLAAYADDVRTFMRQNDVAAAYEVASSVTDSEEKTALWGLLTESKIRSALKKHGAAVISSQLNEEMEATA